MITQEDWRAPLMRWLVKSLHGIIGLAIPLVVLQARIHGVPALFLPDNTAMANNEGETGCA